MHSCREDMASLKSSVFLPKMSGLIPPPPSFKKEFNGDIFSVPQYYPFDHSETLWILNIYRNKNWDKLQRLALLNPSYFRTTYYQVPDSPSSLFGLPMFHDKAILYLTPLALALYLNLDIIVNNLIEFRDQNGNKIISIYQPCYATNIFIHSSENINDMLMFYTPCILILRQSFDCVHTMLINGKWKPLKPFSVLYRRPFKIIKFSYKDIIDYSISQLTRRTSLMLPQFLNFLTKGLSDEFSLLYYEQMATQYHHCQIEEWVSIPRRLLRVAFYYDKEMRLTSQIIRCIQVFQKNGFFVGPTKTCFQINYKQRICALRCNFNDRLGDPEETRVALDQDNCFCLIFALIHHASSFHHYVIKDKLISIIPDLAKDTMWILHFLIKQYGELSKYFSNLVEKVDYLPESVFLQVRQSMMKAIDTNTIRINSLKDLNIKPNETVPPRMILSQFYYMQTKHLGHYVIRPSWENNSNMKKRERSKENLSSTCTENETSESSDDVNEDSHDENEKSYYKTENITKSDYIKDISKRVLYYLEDINSI